MSKVVFNRAIFNDALFNTAEVYGVSKVFKKRKKQKILAQAVIRLQGGIFIPVLIKAESRISFINTIETKGKILTYGNKEINSKISTESITPIKSSVLGTYNIPIKGRLNIMELNSNKLVKHNTIQNILSLLDEE
jgi:hypothetical protein